MSETPIRIEVDGQHFSGYPTSRANVALTVAAALQEEATVGRTVEFGDGTAPITETLAR